MRLGGRLSLVTLQRIAQRRHEYAALFGFALCRFHDAAAHGQERGRGGELPRFGGRRGGRQRAGADLAVLREAKAQATGQPLANTTLQRWDMANLTERVRQQGYAVDQETFRAYFPPQRSLEFVFAVAQRLFGVR